MKVNIGLFGLGTVGSGVIDLIRMRKKELKERYNLEIELKKVCEKNSKTIRELKISKNIVVNNIDKIINDSSIDIIIEVFGGLHPAKEIIIKALKNSKAVITANKSVLAEYGEEIYSLAQKNNSYLGFRAAITGCQDIIEHLILTGTIKGIKGILNGTSNYILTQMEKEKKNFKSILKEAQTAGYAEANPSLDIEGIDTADKLIILTNLSYGCKVKKEDFLVEGIGNISLEDIEFAEKFGYKIRLLGISRKIQDEIDIRVHPALIPYDSSLALIKGVGNALQIDDDLRGKSGFSAPGAGAFPAASAIITDLIAATKRIHPYYPEKIKKLPLKKISSLETKYYLRFNALNQPGVLSKISGILAKNKINIQSVIQKGIEKRGEFTPIIIMTDIAKEEDIQNSKKAIDKLNLISGKTNLIRIEEGVW